MDELQQAVLEVLSAHRGPNVRISRAELSRIVNAGDRRVRKAIELLRSTHPQGCFIVADFPSGGQPGYFLARSPGEALEYMRPDWTRIESTRERLQAQEKLLREPQTADVVQMAMM